MNGDGTTNATKGQNRLATGLLRLRLAGEALAHNRFNPGLLPPPEQCRRRLEAEIGEWEKAGKTIRLFLRDDDAGELTPALDRLTTFCETRQLPLLLAIIPARASDELAKRLETASMITPAAHGYAHVNHRTQQFRLTGRHCELGKDRPVEAVIGELQKGREKLRGWFGEKLSSILVPPWNTIDREIALHLGEAGFSALSCHGWGANSGNPPQLNTHVDIVDWANENKGRPLEAIWHDLALNLKIARLSGFLPVGILSHHLALDEQAWAVLDALASDPVLNGQAKWMKADDLVGIVNSRAR